jgi:aspartate aminotransferase-like enzyme
LEAALVNVLSPGDSVLAVSVGSFGDRFAAIASAFGANVDRLSFPWGTAIDTHRLEEALGTASDHVVLLTTHNETSTGVLNDLDEVAQLLKSLGDRRPLWLVDAISSLGAVPLPMDLWGCDIVVSASQKAWMVPPGLAFVGVGGRAWTAMESALCSRYYFDLQSARSYASRGQTPFTPAVSVLYALRASLRMMEAEGLEAIAARHCRQAHRMREGIKAMGLTLFADERFASPTVTAVEMPRGVTSSELRLRLEDLGVSVAGGQGEYKERLIRIAHLGFCADEDIDATLDALERSLPR